MVGLEELTAYLVKQKIEFKELTPAEIISWCNIQKNSYMQQTELEKSLTDPLDLKDFLRLFRK